MQRFSVFGDSESGEITRSLQLENALSVTRPSIVGNKSYLEQFNLDKALSRDNPQAEALIQDYIEKRDINASNNYAMTLLHILIWADRPDLARKVIESPAFKKINFKFNIPFGQAVMYASALDIAIGNWRCKESAIDLAFIESLLAHGALTPKPDKKFLSGEFINEIYPLIFAGEGAFSETGDARTIDEIKDLFCLLHRYGFSVQEMENDMRRRLFDTEDKNNNRAEEFAEAAGVTIERQRVLFDDFMQKLHAACNDLQKSPLLVEMDNDRLDNGKSTLSLPYDPTDPPCCIQ